MTLQVFRPDTAVNKPKWLNGHCSGKQGAYSQIDGSLHFAQPVLTCADQGGYINFLPRPNAERLALIQGDGDTFADILNLLADYEGMHPVQRLVSPKQSANTTRRPRPARKLGRQSRRKAHRPSHTQRHRAIL